MSWRDKVSNYKFVDFKSTGQFTGVFNGGEEVTGKYGDVVELKFTDKEGNSKVIHTKSARLLGMMKAIPDGALVNIRRSGEQMETVYEVSVIETKASNFVKEVVAKVDPSTPVLNAETEKTLGWPDD